MKSAEQRRRSLLLWGLPLLALLPVFYLHLTALRAADDFYYSTFWLSGPVEFWRLTLQHYATFNGRALVHFVAQTVLAFPQWVFAAVNTLLLCGMGALWARVDSRGQTPARAGIVFFFLAQLLLLSTPVLTQGLLWVSASYNYMFPVFLMVLALRLLDRFLSEPQKGVGALLPFLLVQFAAGATTEQCGFMAAAATGMYGLLWAIRHKKAWWKLFPAPLLNAVGYLTVFLSPATRLRAAEGASLEWDALGAQLGRLAGALFSWEGILLQLLMAAALLALCLALPKARQALGYGVPALLTGALASVLIMAPTGNFAPRVLLPAALTLLLVSARCAAALLRLCKAKSLAPFLWSGLTLCTCVAVCFPLLRGVTQNYALELRNRAAVREARETGVLYYFIDYDERWCYPSLMYTEGSFYSRFLQANRLENCTVYLESARMKPLYLNGKRLSSPGYERDGKIYFPLRDVIEGFGGTVTYRVEGYTVVLNGREVTLSAAGVAVWTDERGRHEYPIVDKRVERYCKASYTAELFRDLFGIDITQAGDRYQCAPVDAIARTAQ